MLACCPASSSGPSEGDPLLALLDVMEALHAPSEDTLAELPALFHPLRAPERFVPFLARWVDLGCPSPRAWAACASWWPRRWSCRAGGARRGGCCSSCARPRAARTSSSRSGCPAPTGVPGPSTCACALRPSWPPHRPMVEAIIEREKPAYVTYELLFEQPHTRSELMPRAFDITATTSE